MQPIRTPLVQTEASSSGLSSTNLLHSAALLPLPDEEHGSLALCLRKLRLKEGVTVKHSAECPNLSDRKPKHELQARPCPEVPKSCEVAAEVDPLCVLALDLETTGRAVARDRIIEVAVVSLTDGSVWRTLVNPGLNFVSKKITELTGITLEDTQQPDVLTTSEALRSLIAFVTKACSKHTKAIKAAATNLPPTHPAVVLSGSIATPASSSSNLPQTSAATAVLLMHNGANFDAPFLRNECLRHGVDLPGSWLFLDSLRLARQHKLSELYSNDGLVDHRLSTLKRYFKVEEDGLAHTALADAQVLAKVFPQLLGLCGHPSVAALLAAGRVGGELRSCRCQLEDREAARNQLLPQLLPGHALPPLAAEQLPAMASAGQHFVCQQLSATGGESTAMRYWSVGLASRPSAPVLLLLRDVRIAFMVDSKFAFQDAKEHGWRPSWNILLSSSTCAVERLGQALDALAVQLLPSHQGKPPVLASSLKTVLKQKMLRVSLLAHAEHGPAASVWRLDSTVHHISTGNARVPLLQPILLADGGGAGGRSRPSSAAQDAAVQAVNAVLRPPPSAKQARTLEREARAAHQLLGQRAQPAAASKRPAAAGTGNGDDGESGNSSSGGGDDGHPNDESSGLGGVGRGVLSAVSGDVASSRANPVPKVGAYCDVVLCLEVLYSSKQACGMKLTAKHILVH